MTDAPAFGTSGLRGPAEGFTADAVAAWAGGFLALCPPGAEIWIGQDLRPSSPRIAADLARACRAAGRDVALCGAVPTPALALGAMAAGAAAVMVTGSHIPADRNGLKFYLPSGEITKADEARIRPCPAPAAPRAGGLRQEDGVEEGWIARVCGEGAGRPLAGARIGLWAHSTVARRGLAAGLRRLGAEVEEFGAAQTFRALDTEAVSAADRAMLAQEARRFDAIVSADGDGDRPLLVDETGALVPGDILGQIAARALAPAVIVTPLTANGGIEALGIPVIRTRVGSPHVLAAMAGAERALGYEANGGLILGHDAEGPLGPIAALPTRDSLLPIVLALLEGRRAGGLSRRIAAEPARATAADRIGAVPPAAAAALLAALEGGGLPLPAPLALRPGARPDRTDGLRLPLADGGILHLRASGNAPELRLYAEAGSAAQAQAILAAGRALAAAHLGDVS